MRKKPFKDTKAFQICTKFLPGLARSVADVIPGGKLITGIIDEITASGKPISAEELEALRAYEREMYSLEVQDRDSARKREGEFVKATGAGDPMMYFVGGVGLASFAYIIYVIVNINLPEENRELFIHAIGLVEGVALSIFTYYFGSSKGSDMKNRLLDRNR